MVTNARSPGSKCYGLVTMSSSTEVTRCVSHLDCTELHGQQIYVERVSYDHMRGGVTVLYAETLCSICFTAVLQAKNDPFKKEGSKKEAEDKAGAIKSNDKRTSTGIKLANKWVAEKAVPVLVFVLFFFFPSTFYLFALLQCRTPPSYKKEDKKLDKLLEKDKDLSKKQETKGGKSESVSSGPDSSVKDDRKHGRKFSSAQLRFRDSV